MADRAEPTVSARLAQWLHAERARGLPGGVREWARVLMLDTLMVGQAGARLPDVGAVQAQQLAWGGAPQSRLWSGAGALPAPQAAFVNALAASALDFDSLHGNVHPDAMALAAAWAVAQAEHASGAQMLSAFVLGAELLCRLARAATGPQKGWTLSAVLGTFGAAASSALLLGLDEQQTAHALGLCLSMAAGSQQANVEQVLAKRLQPALAARAGVQAAYLARAGLTAPAQVFEGRFGLWALYFPCRPEAVLPDRAAGFVVLETGLKKYPVCACGHAAMDALLGAMGPGGVRAEHIDHLEAVVSPFMDRLMGGAFDPQANPQVTAQFSLRYALASIALRGRLGLQELSDEAVRDPAIAAFVRRIALRVDEANTAELAPATVRIRLRDGRVIERTVGEMPGSAAAPLSPAQRRAKFEACAVFASADGSASAAERWSEAVRTIETVGDMAATGPA